MPTESIGVTPGDDSAARPYIGILAVLGLACLLGFSRLAKPKFRLPKALPRWVAWMPLAWFVWQLASLLQTEDEAMSIATVIHFGSCLVAFYLGLLVLARMRLAKLALWGAALGLMMNLLDASLEQFGGLEQTRQSIIAQIESGNLDPAKIPAHLREEGKSLPPEVTRKINKLPPETAAKVRQFPVEMVKRWYSPRLYGHMFYPNALAGLILLLLPVAPSASLQLLPQLIASYSLMSSFNLSRPSTLNSDCEVPVSTVTATSDDHGGMGVMDCRLRHSERGPLRRGADLPADRSRAPAHPRRCVAYAGRLPAACPD